MGGGASILDFTVFDHNCYFLYIFSVAAQKDWQRIHEKNSPSIVINTRLITFSHHIFRMNSFVCGTRKAKSYLTYRKHVRYQ